MQYQVLLITVAPVRVGFAVEPWLYPGFVYSTHPYSVMNPLNPLAPSPQPPASSLPPTLKINLSLT
jgi:hypothetical protein